MVAWDGRKDVITGDIAKKCEHTRTLSFADAGITNAGRLRMRREKGRLTVGRGSERRRRVEGFWEGGWGRSAAAPPPGAGKFPQITSSFFPVLGIISFPF